MSSLQPRLYIALYLDENIALQIAAALARQKYDVMTAHDAKLLGAKDRDQLEFAISQDRALVTHNRNDFLDLHNGWLAEERKHYGIVILVRRRFPSEMIDRLVGLLNTVTADELEGQLRFV